MVEKTLDYRHNIQLMTHAKCLKFKISFLLSLLFWTGCGGSGASGTLISTATDATVTSDTAVLHVSAGAFEENLRVVVIESEASSTEVFDNTILSSKISYRFTKTLLATGDNVATIVISLDPALVASAVLAGTPIYALWRESGVTLSLVDVEDPDDVVADSNVAWQTIFGTLDETANTLTVTLPATAETIDIVVVADDDLVMAVDDSDPDPSVSSVTRGVVSRAVHSLHTPWAVICLTDTLSADDRTACDSASPDYFLGDLLTALTDASAFLQALGWVDTRSTQMTGAQIKALNLPASPAIDSLDGGDARLFNIAYVMNRCPSSPSVAEGDNRHFTSGRGATYVNGDICFKLTSLDPVPQNLFGNVVAHELFHAVQGAYNPQITRDSNIQNEYLWLIEGTATMMGFASQVGEGADLIAKVYDGARRDWSFSLKDKEEFLNEYRAFEFFTYLNNGDIDYLTDFFLALDEQGSDLNSLIDADLATASLFDLTLAEAYTERVMSQRGATSDQNDCTFLNITDDLDDDGSLTLTREYSAEVPDVTLTPISSVCFDIQYDNGDDNCMNFTLNSPDAQQTMLALGANVTGGDRNFNYNGKDGTIIDVGGTLQVQGQTADVRIVRDAYGRSIIDGAEWSLLIEKDDSCNEMSLTGTWCASSDFNGAISPCDDYGSFIQITQNDDNSITGTGMIFVCELAYDIDAGTKSGNNVDITLTTSRTDNTFTDCENDAAIFDLTLTNSTTLTGTWGLDAQTQNIVLTKYSSDPTVLIPFYGVDNGI